MRYLMPYHLLYLGSNIGIVPALRLDWFLENGYFVWRYQAVTPATFGKGYTLVEAKQSVTMPQSSLS